MKIGIDARLIEETGVGRYIRNLLKYLATLDTDNEYVIFLTNTSYDQFSLPNNRWQKRLVNVRWHTLYEQLILPFVFYKENLDVLHIPYFTVPLLYPKKVIKTIHDLTILRFRTGKASTLPRILYILKWLAYVFVIYIGVRKSPLILTVSQSVKEQIHQILHVPLSKIRVAYEGLDEIFFVHKKNRKRVSDQYFLYVGNVYPHKNVEFLMRSFKRFLQSNRVHEKIALVCVGKEDFFYRKLKKFVENLGISHRVVFLHDVSDDELRALYAYAIALVFPSKSEGFGLPALEALAQNCPIIVSDIPVFRELFDKYAMYVKHDERLWSLAFSDAIKEQKKLNVPRDFFETYSWKHLALVTKQAYEDCLRV